MSKWKAALVTGSTRGIGQAIARALAVEGCNVMLNGFGDADAIEKDRAALAEEHGVDVRYNGADLGMESDVDALTRATEDALDRSIFSLTMRALPGAARSSGNALRRSGRKSCRSTSSGSICAVAPSCPG